MSKRWLLMSSGEKNSHLVRVLTKFQEGGRFTAEAVTKALKKEFPGISFYNGTAMSVAGRLAKLGFQRWDEKDPESKMHFWSWPTPPVTIPAEDAPTKRTPEAQLPIEYISHKAAASMERFLLTSEELSGIHKEATPEDDPMHNYYKGRKAAFREALNMFLHLIK